MKQYFVNFGLYVRGIRWLWTRNDSPKFEDGVVRVISYKPGWSPLKFLPLYLTDYLVAVLLGRGVQSLSRAFKLFGESHHWGQTGPILWGSKDLWNGE